MSVAELTPTANEAHRCDVALLRWPAQEEQRARLERDGLPRLLLVSRGGPAPACVDELEDWVREPLDPDEIEIRTATLRRRSRRRSGRPQLDSSGLVRVGDRWVHLPPVQQPVVRLLIERFGRVVRAEDIELAYRGAGGSLHPKAVKAMIGRVKRRLAELDLALSNVRDCGYLLEAGPRRQGPSAARRSGRGGSASTSRSDERGGRDTLR
jgi:hypothetical protein